MRGLNKSVLFLLLMALMPCAQGETIKQTSQANQVLDEFFLAIKNRQFDKAYSYLDSRFQARTTFAEFNRHLTEKSFLDFRKLEWKESMAGDLSNVVHIGEMIDNSDELISLRIGMLEQNGKWTIRLIGGERKGEKFYFTFHENEIKAIKYFELIEAAEHRNYKEVLKLLEAGVDPSGFDFLKGPDTGSAEEYFAHMSDTPLHHAVAQGDYKIAQLLIKHGAALDFCCCDCRTALHGAIEGGHPELVELLLQSGADPTLPYDEEPDCFWLAKKKQNPAIKAVMEKFRKIDVISPKYQKYHAGYGAITFDEIVNDTVAGRIDLVSKEADPLLDALSGEELIKLRNSIFAKYGYIFEKSWLGIYFSKFNWYPLKRGMWN